jgi:hypothetical protein
MKKHILLIIALFYSPLSFAQIGITAKTGQIYSFSKALRNKGNPSPYFRVGPYVSTGFMGAVVSYTYDKYVFEIGWEYTEVGSQTYDATAATLCAGCDEVKKFNSAYGVPIHSFPIRVGYRLYNRKRIDVFSKLGYFQVSRKGDPIGFANENYFGPYSISKDFFYQEIDGKPFGFVSYNLQSSTSIRYIIDKNQKYALTLDVIYNQGLKKIAEDSYETILYKTNQKFTNYVTRRGSFAGFNIGFTRIFQNSAPKIKKKKKKKVIKYKTEKCD